MLLAALYFVLAAGVIFVLALTDFSGFIGSAQSVILLVALLAAGVALGFLGVRTLRVRREDREQPLG